jgi:transposase
LSDTAWARLARLIIPKHPRGGRPCPPERWREFLIAILYVVRTGRPWRALPQNFKVLLVHDAQALHAIEPNQRLAKDPASGP